MKTNKAFLAGLAALLLAGNMSYAHSRVVCGSDQYYQQHSNERPEVSQLENKLNQAALHSERAEDTNVLVIPVVFHVIYKNSAGPENVSRKTIEDQLATLNDAFRKRNKDTVGISSQFKHLAADARIEFRLATRDPWGYCTDGIDRKLSAMTDNANDNVKPFAWWDSREYLNIWIVKSLQQTNPLGVLAGYSQFPWDKRPATDGIVIGYQFIGKGKKTLIHEVGHYLGLYHTFQYGCEGDPALEGDHVKDTPPAYEANFGCDKATNSCHEDSPDLPDMLDNYMDYSDCTHMFTTLQVKRMRWFLKGDRGQMISAENHSYVFSCASSIAEEKSRSMQVSVYPNPASGDVTFMIPDGGEQSVAIEAYDITGRRTNAIKTRLLNGQVQLPRDQIGVANGIYCVRISTAEMSGYVRLILVK